MESAGREEWMPFFETNVLDGVGLSRHYVAGMRARNWGPHHLRLS